jgi:hypothetical protein
VPEPSGQPVSTIAPGECQSDSFPLETRGHNSERLYRPIPTGSGASLHFDAAKLFTLCQTLFEMLQRRDEFAEVIFANPDWQDLIRELVNQLANDTLRNQSLERFPPETIPSDCGRLAIAIYRHFQTADLSGRVDDLWALLREHEQWLENFMGQDQFVKDLIFVLPLKPAKVRTLVRYACSRVSESDKASVCVVRRMIELWPELKGDILARVPRNVDLKIIRDDLNSVLKYY